MNKLFLLIPLVLIAFPMYDAYGGSNWHDTDFLKARSISIDSGDIDSDLTDYPLYLNMTTLNIGTDTLSNCNDILFTTADNVTKLSHEFESCDATNDYFEAWIKVPSVSSSTDTKIIMYYDNSGATDQEDKENVWSDFVFVYHMNDTLTVAEDIVADSTANSYDLNAGSAINILETTGISDDGFLFNGASSNLNSAQDEINDMRNEETRSYTAWIKVANTIGDQVYILETGRTFTNDVQGIGLQTDGDLRFESDADTTAGVWSSANQPVFGNLEQWTHIGVTYDRSSENNNPVMYSNGTSLSVTENTTPVGLPQTNDDTLEIGSRLSGAKQMDGRIDEVRMYRGILTASWMSADYNCQRSESAQSCISSVSAEQERPAIVIPTFYESDGTTLVTSGSILQENTTSKQTISINSTGQAKFTGLTGLNNFTAITDDNYHVNKTLNYNIVDNYSLFDINAFIERISCASNGSNDDIIIKVNASQFSNGAEAHYISAQTTPTCAIDDDISWTTTLTPTGLKTGQVTSIVTAEIIATQQFGANSDLFQVNSTTITTSYSEPDITSNSFVAGQNEDTLSLSFFLSLVEPTNPPPIGGSEGGTGGGQPTESIFDYTVIGGSHTVGFGFSIPGEITVEWDSGEDLTIHDILVGRENIDSIDVIFNQDFPYNLDWDVDQTKTTRTIPYTLETPPNICTDEPGPGETVDVNSINSNCAEARKYEIPIDVVVLEGSKLITKDTVITANLSTFAGNPLFALVGIVGLIAIGTVGIIKAQNKKRK